MIAYQLKLAWRSLRRNPVLSILLVAGIGLGIAVSMTFVTAYANVAGDPIPGKSDRLRYVQIDAWDPERPWDDDDPSQPPAELTYMDAVAVTGSDIPTAATPMYITNLTVHPANDDLRPFREISRLCFNDFFAMFDVPFRYGGAWSDAADERPEQVAVIGEELNRRLFGGEDSTGRSLRIEDREFKIVGVLEHWRPVPKYYDTHNNPFGPAEEIYLPFFHGREMKLRTSGNTSSWGNSGSTWEERAQSEAIWVQAWVQLDTPAQVERYAAFLSGYVDEQKKAGRHGRPENNMLRDVMAWLDYQQVVTGQARAMLINALLFLLVCSVNLIGILLGKFLARAPEIGVRRALGASRRWVFVQHLIECQVIGILGCVLGLGLTVFGLEGLDRIYDSQLNYTLDGGLLLVALALAMVSAAVAGIYPAWRICRISPGLHLKAQ